MRTKPMHPHLYLCALGALVSAVALGLATTQPAAADPLAALDIAAATDPAPLPLTAPTGTLAAESLPAAALGGPLPAATNWSRHVWTTGGQRQIDQCKGAVRVSFSSGRAVIAEHNYCGGKWILSVKIGQTVRLTGAVSGTFKAVAAKSVPRGSSSAVLNGMGTSGFVLQTCYFNSNNMRLVGLTRIAAPKPAPKPKPTCAGYKATIVGSARANRIVGTAGRDVIVAGAGNDWIDGRGGNDIICAGTGNDRVYGGGGNDRIYGEAGTDTLFGGSGNDYVRGGAGNDALHGESGADSLLGDSGADRLWGGASNDSLRGGTGNDTLRGGAGSDAIRGEAGHDWMYGDAGRDRLYGGPGTDRFYGGTGVDRYYT